MPYLPADGPVPSIDDAPFWESCRRRELRFQSCGDCGRFRHPPVPACARCQSQDVSWGLASEDARVFSYTIVHHPVSEAMRAHVPYNIVIVEFPARDEVKLISNVVDLPPGEIRLGMPLSVVWEEAANGTPLPRFKGRS